MSLYHVFDREAQIGWMDDRTVSVACFGDDGHDARRGLRSAHGSVWDELPIEADHGVVGRVVRVSDGSEAWECFGFELAQPRGLTFAESVRLFHRVLAAARGEGQDARPTAPDSA